MSDILKLLDVARKNIFVSQAKVEKLEQQLKDAESVIDGLSKYYDLYSEAWLTSEYEFLLKAKQYLTKYKTKE